MRQFRITFTIAVPDGSKGDRLLDYLVGMLKTSNDRLTNHFLARSYDLAGGSTAIGIGAPVQAEWEIVGEPVAAPPA